MRPEAAARSDRAEGCEAAAAGSDIVRGDFDELQLSAFLDREDILREERRYERRRSKLDVYAFFGAVRDVDRLINRQSGVVDLDCGRAAEADAIYTDDLRMLHLARFTKDQKGGAHGSQEVARYRAGTRLRLHGGCGLGTKQDDGQKWGRPPA